MEKKANYKWIVYKTTNIVNNHFYIGVHQCTTLKFDGYLGMGIYINQPSTYNTGKTKLQRAVMKYGTKNFKRETLAIYDTAEDAYTLEEELVTTSFLEREDVYNMIPGGSSKGYEYKKIKVYQYDINGKYQNTFNSYAEAGKAVGLTYCSISRAVRFKTRAANSYWATIKVDNINIKEFDTINYNPVYLYSSNGDYLQEFKSELDCAEFIYNTRHASTIYKALEFGIKIKDYYISYYKANTFTEANTEYVKHRAVYRYTNEGIFDKAYNTLLEACKDNKYSNIIESIKNKESDSNGFKWALYKAPKYNVNTICYFSKPVGKYSLDGELIEEYKSATQAAKANGTSVWKALKGSIQTYKNHVYKYM